MTAYYVSSSEGNDLDRDGLSAQYPLASVQKATSRMMPGDTLLLKSGDIFRETVRPVSGSAEKRTVVSTYGKGKATILGTKPVSGWQTHAPNILKAQVSASCNFGVGKNQVFLVSPTGDRTMLVEARWPKIPSGKTIFALQSFQDYALSDTGGYDPASLDAQGNYIGYYTDADLEIFPDGSLVGSTIFMLPGRAWGGQSATVVNHVRGRIDFLFKARSTTASVGLSAYLPSRSNPYFLYGKLNLLSQEGEFFVDADSNIYIYRNSGSLDGYSVEIKSTDLALDLKDLSYVTVENLKIFAGRIVDSPNSLEIILSNIDSEYGYHNAWDAQAAIRLRGEKAKLLSSTVSKTSGIGVHLEKPMSEVRNNVIYAVDYFGLGGGGLRAQTTALKSTIANNSVFAVGSHGIEANCPGSLIANNRVWNFGLKVTDIGGINAYACGDGQGTRICYNIVHDGRAHYDADLYFNGTALFRLDSGNQNEGVSNFKLDSNIGWASTHVALGCWPLKKNHSNYGNSKNIFANNVFLGKMSLFNKTDHSYAGTEFVNNIVETYAYDGNNAPVPDGAKISNNLFIKNSLADNLTGDPGFVCLHNLNFMLAENSCCVNSQVETLPGNIGPIELKTKPFVAGAVLRNEDISSLQFEQDSKNPYKIHITGMPKGRMLPSSFKISVQGGIESANFYNIVDPNTNEIEGIAYIDESNEGSRNLQISLDGLEFTNVNKIVDLGEVAIYSCTESGGRLTLTGRKFYTQNYYTIPVRISGLIEGTMEIPFFIKVNTADLISRGLMRSDCADLRIMNYDCSEELYYWIESGINTAETVIWLKSSVSNKRKVQIFEDFSYINIAFGNHAWTSTTSNMSNIFPQLDRKIDFWLKAQDLNLTDLNSVSKWEGMGITATENEPTRQPKFKRDGINGFPIVEFDGENDRLFLGGKFTTSSVGTFFVVYANPKPGANKTQRLLSTSAPGTADYTVGLGMNVPNDGTAAIASPSGAITVIVVNSPKDLTNIYCGMKHSTWNNGYKGGILEILASSELFSSTQQKSYKNFFELKYALKSPSPKAVVDSKAMCSPIKIDIDGVACRNIIVQSPTQIQCDVVSAFKSGSVVKVTIPTGEVASLIV